VGNVFLREERREAKKEGMSECALAKRGGESRVEKQIERDEEDRRAEAAKEKQKDPNWQLPWVASKQEGNAQILGNWGLKYGKEKKLMHNTIRSKKKVD